MVLAMTYIIINDLYSTKVVMPGAILGTKSPLRGTHYYPGTAAAATGALKYTFQQKQ